MIICFEGVDGTGKTTLARRISKRLRATYYRTPPESMQTDRVGIDANSTDWEHYNFYRRAVHLASEEIASMSGSDVVIDRYWMSTLVYHLVMGIHVQREDFQDLLQPQCVVYLSVDHGVQMSRLYARGMTPGDERMLSRQLNLASTYEKMLALTNLPIIRLDTSHKNLDECEEYLAREIALIT